MKHRFLILFLFVAANDLAAQLKKTTEFFYKSNFCSGTILLDSAGFFFKEQGCEERSTASFGKYKIDSTNHLTLHFLPFDSIKPIIKITHLPAVRKNDSIITIRFYDRFKMPLNRHTAIVTLDNQNKPTEFYTDQYGRIRLNRYLIKDISLLPIDNLYGQRVTIDISDKPLRVYLNLPNDQLFSREVKSEEVETQTIHYKMLPKGLYDEKTRTFSYDRRYY